MSLRRRLLALPVVLAVPAVAQAQETRTSVDVAVSGGYANNPFSQGGSNSSSGYVAFDVTPQLQLLTERSTFTASAAAHVQQYFTRYPTTDSYTGSLGYRGRPSSRVSTFARVDLTSAILGSYQDYVPGGFIDTGTSAGTGGAPQVGGSTTNPGTGTIGGGTIGGGSIGGGPIIDTGGLINDIGLFGTRDRRRSLYATAGISAGLSERDSISGSVFGDFARYRNFGAVSDYNGYGGTVAYSRALSTYTNLGVQASGSRYEYNGLSGDTNVYSIQATGSTQINKFWLLQGALGASFIDSNAAGSTNRTSLSGNVSLCSQGERTNTCFFASRAARATGFNGSQYVTSVGANVQHRLDERSSIGLTGSYVKEGGLRTLNNVQNEYLAISPSYSRRLLERLQLIASARYRQVFGSSVSRAADYGGQLGVSYHIGRLR